MSKAIVIDADFATDYGIEASVLMNYITFWVLKNKANNTHFYDGYHWTYNSLKAFQEEFPFIKKHTLLKTIKMLEDNDFIKIGNYNQSAYDRTQWYTVTEKGFMEYGISMNRKQKIHFLNSENGCTENEQPIPLETPLYKPLKKENNIKRNDFTIPTIEEIQEYINEKGYNFEAEDFFNFYESNGWMVGKNHMKNWKAACGTWKKNNRQHYRPNNMTAYERAVEARRNDPHNQTHYYETPDDAEIPF